MLLLLCCRFVISGSLTFTSRLANTDVCMDRTHAQSHVSQQIAESCFHVSLFFIEQKQTLIESNTRT